MHRYFLQAETVECAPDISEERKIDRMDLTEDKQELTEDKQELTEDRQRSNKDEEDALDVDEDINRPVSQNKDQSAVILEDNGGVSSESKDNAEKKDGEDEIESLARRKLEQILKSRETLITNNVAEVITLDGDNEDGVSETMISSKSIDDEKYMGMANALEEESGDRDHTRDQAEEGKIVEEDMVTDQEDVTEERENKSGSDQPRKPVDHDYEADPRAKSESESVEGPDTTKSKSENSDSVSVTTEKESSPGTSLRLVSLSNLVPNSPPPSEPKGNPAPSWTVAEVAQII